jgi:hypothetical protein
MEPQLIQAGRHNDNLPESTQRILEGGSWKTQRTIMLIPASTTIPTKVYLSHCSLIFPPNQAAHRMAAIGMEVGQAFSNAIESILSTPGLSDWEYLLTIEHDNCPAPDGLVRLIAQMEKHPEFAAIGGLYWTKGEGGVPQIWGDAKDATINFRPQIPKAGELVECCGTGMGFTLFRLSMFKDERIKRPWFRTIAGTEGVGTQDLSFWAEARKYGYRCAIDCGVLVGHYDMDGKFGPADVMW